MKCGSWPCKWPATFRQPYGEAYIIMSGYAIATIDNRYGLQIKTPIKGFKVRTLDKDGGN